MASDGFTTDDDDDLAVLEFVAREPAEALGIESSATDKVLHNKKIKRYFLKPKTVKARIFCLSFWFIIAGGLIALAWWLTPIILKHIVVPLQSTIQEKCNPVAVAFLVIAGTVLVPIVLIPAGPFIWLAAVSLGVWKGFLVVQLATALSMSVTYGLGRWLLRERIKKRVEHKDWAQALFIAVKEAGPFKVVLLMRLGPAPYSMLSYTCSLSPDIRYWPYIIASVIGRTLHNIIDIYIGTGVSTAGEAASGEKVDPVLITFYTVGFVFAVALSLWGYLYAKRTLRDLRARALARESVLSAFSFQEAEDDASETDHPEFERRISGLSLERGASMERRKSFRGSRRDIRPDEDDREGLLNGGEIEMSEATPKSRKHERRKSGSLDRNDSHTLQAVVIADSSSQAEAETDSSALLNNQTARSS